ncbi:indolepyruvate ferredoxin oxidoreductase subunit alpha [Calditerrivibrio nitroreducens]|uniref:2-oxoglutarate ferredoxin oxidoreductase, delta subunit n=1 Tax=Calditerrivibrio nitroreducens (strain DSM 19672 / NBRC 101217 / Yu37-1) TaxID=768670 RepID=E4TJN3_CALNY|nr:4Fe-4S binding protein [Calditerrivibrio nitroreducens]ADR18195.1 2-oxoglutarate ferredoxin oxidoreductase, delta subunit [Calditerrivibrio nitroreducens DSM 19672]
MPKVIIDTDKCKGCGICIVYCPKKILRFSGKFNTSGYNYVECIDEFLCILCKSCALMCPDVIFTLKKDE